MKNLVSVQSTVLNDKVGNHAARSILSDKGYKFYEIPTVILTSHKGVKSTLQISDNNLNPWIIFNKVRQTYKLNLNDLTIVGYTPNLKVSKSISKIIKIQNRVILDPVMGDIGIGLYVEKDVANFFKKIMTKVKYISANFFEWSYLNNKDVNNYNLGEIIADLKSFTKRFNSQVLIRSVPKNKKLLAEQFFLRSYIVSVLVVFESNYFYAIVNSKPQNLPIDQTILYVRINLHVVDGIGARYWKLVGP